MELSSGRGRRSTVAWITLKLGCRTLQVQRQTLRSADGNYSDLRDTEKNNNKQQQNRRSRREILTRYVTRRGQLVP